MTYEDRLLLEAYDVMYEEASEESNDKDEKAEKFKKKAKLARNIAIGAGVSTVAGLGATELIKMANAKKLEKNCNKLDADTLQIMSDMMSAAIKDTEANSKNDYRSKILLKNQQKTLRTVNKVLRSKKNA
jgi:hypothetical protein